MSLHANWYISDAAPTTPSKQASSSFFFWKTKNPLPVTDIDKEWTENALVLLYEVIGTDYFRSLSTITPDKEYFNYVFKGTEADAEFVLQRLITLLQIDAWEIDLIFFSNASNHLSDGTLVTPQEKLKGSWKSSSSEYVDNGLGHKEIWIELDVLRNPEGLIATLANELTKYKLLSEYMIEDNDVLLFELAAVVFGFGVFKGNAYFNFTRWQVGRAQGWQMQKRGHLPEQMIAYAMAWLTHYRQEDIGWKHYLNKTMRKYFEQCYSYIDKNKDTVKFPV